MAHARPRYRFQYDMSINDTPLTRALEKGDFPTAILIIKNSASDPELLEDGPYERFPLYIVLSGKYNASEITLPNLHIAHLLLENGAQPNRRGTMYNDMETFSHSATPMELLVEYFGKIQLQQRYKQDVSPVIGIDGHVKVQYNDIREHLLCLLQTFIAHGGRLSFRPNILGLTHLVNILWTSPDVDFLRCLYEAGVDVNHVDVHGRTALHLLCQAEYPTENMETRMKAINYLLKHTNIQVWKYSCKFHSCLWYAFKYCHFDAVSLLLSHDPSLDQTVGPKVFLSAEPEACHTDVLVAERLHPLLIPFVPMRDQYLKTYKQCYPNNSKQETHVLKHIAGFVDQGYFCDSGTDKWISKTLNWNPKFQMHGKMLCNLCGKKQLVPFLFGRISTKLKILCARQIFQKCLQLSDSNVEDKSLDFVDCPEVSDQSCLQRTTLPHHLRLDFTTSKSIFDVDFEDLTLLLNSMRLPLSFLNIFEFELYRRKLLVMLSHSDSDRLKCTCLADEQGQLENSSSESSSTEDFSEFEGDGEAVRLISVNLLQ